MAKWKRRSSEMKLECKAFLSRQPRTKSTSSVQEGSRRCFLDQENCTQENAQWRKAKQVHWGECPKGKVGLAMTGWHVWVGSSFPARKTFSTEPTLFINPLVCNCYLCSHIVDVPILNPVWKTNLLKIFLKIYKVRKVVAHWSATSKEAGLKHPLFWESFKFFPKFSWFACFNHIQDVHFWHKANNVEI